MTRLALVVPLLCAACGGAEPAARLRLWTLDAALHAAPPPPAPELRFATAFEHGLALGEGERWDEVCYPTRGAPELEARVEREDERSFLRLAGVHGGLRVVLPVEPNTCYVFSGRVRANGIEADAAEGDPAGFDGASFWFGETSALAPFSELLSTRAALITKSWSSASAVGWQGWRELRQVFVTAPGTRFLHLVCSLAVHESVRAGTADFAELSLERSSIELLWREALEAETARRTAVDPPEHAWQGARRVSARLGGEYRPAIVLLPGERLVFELPELGEEPRLAIGAGAWRPLLLEPLGGTATLRVSAGGRELLARAFEASAARAAGRWEELALALPARTLELALSGDAPLAIGAPLVRTRAARARGPSVLLVSLDTLRADHVGAYGYPLGTTPHLDRLAARGLLCRDASSQAPYTLPSHATLLTGQFPSVHGVVTRGRTLAAARSTSLAETLARAGWATQAFTAGGFVNADFGLDRGFEGFGVIDPLREDGSHYLRNLARKVGPARAAELVDAHGFAGVERWLADRRDERFFLFLHTYTVHDYDPPESYLRCEELGCARPAVPLRTRTPEEGAAFTPEMRAHVVHLYDAALRYADERLGRLLARMDELGLLDETLVVVTSDHGEEFFEHGALQHGRTLYEELLAIPLIFAGPGIEPRVLERPALLADVAPTVLARLGLARDPHAQGVDLLGPEWPARALWSEVDDRFAHKYALRDERGRKTIHGPDTPGIEFRNEKTWEWFDLEQDPREARDRAVEGGAEFLEAQRMLERHRSALEELGASLGELGRGGVDAETMEDLKELGY